MVSQVRLPILLGSVPLAGTPPNHCRSSTKPSMGNLSVRRLLSLLSTSVQLSKPNSETHKPNIFFGGTGGHIPADLIARGLHLPRIDREIPTLFVDMVEKQSVIGVIGAYSIHY